MYQDVHFSDNATRKGKIWPRDYSYWVRWHSILALVNEGEDYEKYIDGLTESQRTSEANLCGEE